MEISPDVAEWTTRGSVDAGDGELQSWSAVSTVGQELERAQGNSPLTKGAKAAGLGGCRGQVETAWLIASRMDNWIPAFAGMTQFVIPAISRISRSTAPERGMNSLGRSRPRLLFEDEHDDEDDFQKANLLVGLPCQ